MKIQLDMTKLSDHEQLPTIDVFVRQEHQYPEPTAGADGVTFPPIPTLKWLAGTTSIIAIGTASLTTQPIDTNKFQGLTIVLPATSQTRTATAAERYAHLKQEIVASGVPLLNDEELRAEIRERKGVKAETKS